MLLARLSPTWYVSRLVDSRVFTDKVQCVFQVNRETGELTLTELAPGIEVEEVRSKTGAKFTVAEQLDIME